MNRRVVIKLGGSALQNPETILQLAQLIKGYQEKFFQVVVVHGGGPAINAELTKRGITWTFINGQRQTTPEMIAVVNHVLAGTVNSDLVSQLQSSGLFATGLSGADDQILFCTQASVELMQVGKVESVDTSAVESILSNGNNRVPVIAPIGFGSNHEKYNINADTAATQIAIALKAEQIVFLTDQLGLLDGEKNLVQYATPEIISEMILDGTISGGMLAKVQAMMIALDQGIQRVRVLHASLAAALLDSENIGTSLSKPNPIHGATNERTSKY